MKNREQARLALRIIVAPDRILYIDDYNLLGYDTYKFGYYGKPNEEEVVNKAIEIILDFIESPSPQ